MTFKKCFSILIYYSLMKNNDLSLPLLKIFKNYCLIKPHYFWPLLINEAIKHNFQGMYFIYQSLSIITISLIVMSTKIYF